VSAVAVFAQPTLFNLDRWILGLIHFFFSKTTGMNQSGTAGARGGFIKPITGDAREQEMDENLGDVHSMLGSLKAQAQAMGDEIGEQNERLDRIQSRLKRPGTGGQEKRQRVIGNTVASISWSTTF
jgi:hypothetical protein